MNYVDEVMRYDKGDEHGSVIFVPKDIYFGYINQVLALHNKPKDEHGFVSLKIGDKIVALEDMRTK